MAHHLLRSTTLTSLYKPVLSTPPQPSLSQAIKMYSQSNQPDHVIGERGTSTAEEFIRVAKEKAEQVTHKNKWEDVKEVNESDPKSARKHYKETVEKGNYDKVGKE